jgi:ketosteroid isomerase-like protein
MTRSDSHTALAVLALAAQTAERDTERAMSQENVEIVRRFMAASQEAFATAELATAFPADTVSADFEWILPRGLDGKAVWTGVEEATEFLRLWTDQFDDFSIDVVRLVDVGDERVAVLLHQSATGKESGVPVVWDVGMVFELEGGRIVRGRNYLSHADALEAAGLSE